MFSYSHFDRRNLYADIPAVGKLAQMINHRLAARLCGSEEPVRSVISSHVQQGTRLRD